MAKDKHGTRFNGMPSDQSMSEVLKQQKLGFMGVSDARIDPDVGLLIGRMKHVAAAQKEHPRPGRPVDTNLYLLVLEELARAGIPIRDWDQSAAVKHLVDIGYLVRDGGRPDEERRIKLQEDTAQSILRRLVDLRDNKTPQEWRTPPIA